MNNIVSRLKDFEYALVCARKNKTNSLVVFSTADYLIWHQKRCIKEFEGVTPTSESLIYFRQLLVLIKETTNFLSELART